MENVALFRGNNVLTVTPSELDLSAKAFSSDEEFGATTVAAAIPKRRKTPRRASALVAMNKSVAENLQDEFDSQQIKKTERAAPKKTPKKVEKQISEKSINAKATRISKTRARSKSKAQKAKKDQWALTSSDEDETTAVRVSRPIKRKSRLSTVSKGNLYN